VRSRVYPWNNPWNNAALVILGPPELRPSAIETYYAIFGVLGVEASDILPEKL